MSMTVPTVEEPAELCSRRAQLAAQQAVVDAARHAANSNAQIPGAPELSHIGTALIQELRAAIRALDKAQAAGDNIMSTTHVDMEMMILQHLTAQSALLQQIAAGLVMLTQSLDKLQPMPHVKLGTDSKGMVKPEVNVYHPDATQAASLCEDVFDALDGKYNPSIEHRDKAITIPFARVEEADRIASALKDALE